MQVDLNNSVCQMHEWKELMRVCFVPLSFFSISFPIKEFIQYLFSSNQNRIFYIHIYSLSTLNIVIYLRADCLVKVFEFPVEKWIRNTLKGRGGRSMLRFIENIIGPDLHWEGKTLWKGSSLNVLSLSVCVCVRQSCVQTSSVVFNLYMCATVCHCTGSVSLSSSPSVFH